MASLTDRPDIRSVDRTGDRFGDRLVRWAPYLFLAVTLGRVVQQAARPLADPDSWWHLRLGEDFLRQGSLSVPAHWSTFATSHWVPTQPLPEIVSALVNRAFGLEGLVWMYVATLVVLLLGIYLLDRVYAAPLPAAIATMLFLASAEAAMTPRPQLLSYGFLALVVVAWLRTEQDLRPRWWLVPLSWLWSLCHGFWFIGVGFGALAVVAVVAGRRASPATVARLASIPLASAAVVLLNPVGPGVLLAPFAVNERGHYITEWQHARLTSGPTLTVVVMAAICAGVWVWRRQDVTWFKVLVALSALFLAWYAVRTVALAGVVMSPLVASALETVLASSSASREPGPGSSRRERRTVVGCAVALLAVVALVVPHTAARPGRVPLGLDDKLDALPAGTTVLDDFTLGGWLSWRHPDLNRWVDGLADAYPVAHLRETQLLMVQGPGWQRVLDRSGARVALLADGSSVDRALERLGWERDGTDRGWVLLRHPGS